MIGLDKPNAKRINLEGSACSKALSKIAETMKGILLKKRMIRSNISELIPYALTAYYLKIILKLR